MKFCVVQIYYEGETAYIDDVYGPFGDREAAQRYADSHNRTQSSLGPYGSRYKVATLQNPVDKP